MGLGNIPMIIHVRADDLSWIENRIIIERELTCTSRDRNEHAR